MQGGGEARIGGEEDGVESDRTWSGGGEVGRRGGWTDGDGGGGGGGVGGDGGGGATIWRRRQ